MKGIILCFVKTVPFWIHIIQYHIIIEIKKWYSIFLHRYVLIKIGIQKIISHILESEIHIL